MKKKQDINSHSNEKKLPTFHGIGIVYLMFHTLSFVTVLKMNLKAPYLHAMVVPRDAVHHGKRSHSGRLRFPHDIQYHGGCGGEGEFGGSLRPPGGTAWDGVGDGQVQPDISCGRREDRWEELHLGTRRPDGISSNYLTDGTGENLENTKALVCTPGYIWEKWSEAAY